MRSRGLRNIVIELTSLLDVVMILIFAVMIQYSNVAANSEENYEQVKEELEGVQSELDLAREELAAGDIENLIKEATAANAKLEAYEYLDNVVVILNVSLGNKVDNKYRVLSYGINTERGYTSNPIPRDDETEYKKEINLLKDYLTGKINNTPADTYLFIVFSYDPQNINGDDYDLLKEILSTKAGLGDNIFFCENNTREEQQ